MPYKSFDFIPAFTQQDMDYISFCSISRDGRKIAFFVRANKMDGVTTGGYIYDVFLRENGRNTRVTHLGAKYRLYGVALSPDGSRLTLISEDRKTYENRLWVGNSDGSDMRDITLSSEQVAEL
jgi:Tol biopolymer transport system component